MKRLLAFTLAALTAVSFSACGKKQDQASGGKTAEQSDKNIIENVPTTPSEYLEYVLIEKPDIAKALGAGIDNIKNREENAAASGNIDISVGGGTKAFLEAINSEAGAAYSQFEWFKSANLNFDATMNNNDTMDVAAKLGINDSHIISMNVIAALGQNAMFVNVPELSALTLKADLGEYLPITSFNIYSDYLPEGKTVEKLVYKFADVVLAELDDITKTDDYTMTVNGVSQDVTKLSINIDSEDVVDISRAVVTTTIEDADIKNIKTNLAEKNHRDAGYATADALVNTIYANLESALENINNANTDVEGVLGVNIYTSSDHDITSFELCYNDEDAIVWNYAENADKCAFILSVENNAILQGNGTVTNKVLNANVTIYDTEQHLIGTADIRNLNLASVENGMLNGSVAIKPSENFIADADLAQMLAQCELVLDFKQTSSTDAEVAATINYGGIKAFAIKISCNEKQPSAISIPENALNAADESAMETFRGSMTFDAIIDNISKAGASKLLTLFLM